jgi:hypothetical protein
MAQRNFKNSLAPGSDHHHSLPQPGFEPGCNARLARPGVGWKGALLLLLGAPCSVVWEQNLKVEHVLTDTDRDTMQSNTGHTLVTVKNQNLNLRVLFAYETY